jgi:diguanylate cyclase (GGDEF)-like protein
VPTAAGAAEPGLTLKTLDGSPLGSIAWQPDRPGSALLHRLLPVLGVLTLGLIGTAALILHQARRAALLIRASEERAFTEPLTGLPNRLLLRDRIELELARQRRDGGAPAVLYLDLDRFKPVNDTHGHAVGDEVLRQVAQRLRTCVRETDTLARPGGDEFVILVAEARTAAAAIRCAERARAAMAPPFQVGDLLLTVRVSIGIALAGAGRPDPDALLRAADRALYLAKRSGRGSWHLAEDLEPSGPLVPGSGGISESPQPVVV